MLNHFARDTHSVTRLHYIRRRCAIIFGNSSLSYFPRKKIREIVGDPLILVGSMIHSNSGGDVCFDCWQLDEEKGERGKVECKRTIKVSDKGISEIGGGM